MSKVFKMTPFNLESFTNGTPAISRCNQKWTYHPTMSESNNLIGISDDRMAYFNCDGTYIGVVPHEDDLIYMVEVK